MVVFRWQAELRWVAKRRGGRTLGPKIQGFACYSQPVPISSAANGSRKIWNHFRAVDKTVLGPCFVRRQKHQLRYTCPRLWAELCSARTSRRVGVADADTKRDAPPRCFSFWIGADISRGLSVTEWNISNLISVQRVFHHGGYTWVLQSSEKITNNLEHPSPLTLEIITLLGTNR